MVSGGLSRNTVLTVLCALASWAQFQLLLHLPSSHTSVPLPRPLLELGSRFAAHRFQNSILLFGTTIQQADGWEPWGVRPGVA
jgi:hypothetical protein